MKPPLLLHPIHRFALHLALRSPIAADLPQHPTRRRRLVGTCGGSMEEYRKYLKTIEHVLFKEKAWCLGENNNVCVLIDINQGFCLGIIRMSKSSSHRSAKKSNPPLPPAWAWQGSRSESRGACGNGQNQTGTFVGMITLHVPTYFKG